MKTSLAIALLFFFFTSLEAQTIIKMGKESGVYTMPCKVNGLQLKFIFDTGASDVSLGLTEAVFMLKNDYLRENDIEGSAQYSIANGDIAEGTIINLREVIIGDIVLNDIKASVIHNINAPLLLGQSALKELGNIAFDYAKSELIINSNTQELESVKNNESVDYILKGDHYLYQERNDLDSSLYYYDLAIKEGNIQGYYKRARALHWALPNYPNKSKKKLKESVLNDYKKAANYGCKEACYYLGTAYFLGKDDDKHLWLGTKQDIDYSLFYLKQAAEGGIKEAEYLLQHITYYKLLKRERGARWVDALAGFGAGLQGETYDSNEYVSKQLQQERGDIYAEYPDIIYDRITYYNKELIQLDDIVIDEEAPKFKRFYAYRTQILIKYILEEMEWVAQKIN